ncbi:hypothetical protein K491DRAFT_682854 [Lophiostoma macrostomum CBS 122681]|uniref:Uncharacterized protein n=1 Tax=Lophiostoma macrostomum CBS 122681 TaxID=1314788 RepID=A0A6A6SW06_9PLEO|nr:hypothetical protein K491DRAFT_682854 [Lophiostoma macrostomum CBS 122681]
MSVIKGYFPKAVALPTVAWPILAEQGSNGRRLLQRSSSAERQWILLPNLNRSLPSTMDVKKLISMPHLGFEQCLTYLWILDAGQGILDRFLKLLQVLTSRKHRLSFALIIPETWQDAGSGMRPPKVSPGVPRIQTLVTHVETPARDPQARVSISAIVPTCRHPSRADPDRATDVSKPVDASATRRRGRRDSRDMQLYMTNGAQRLFST